MSLLRIASIVEGEGEELAVPTLLKRVAAEVAPLCQLAMPSPFRKTKSQLVRPGGLESVLQLLRARETPDAIFVLLDSDGDCPAKHGPELLSRAQAAASGIPVAVVLAHREYEAWFLAAAPSLRGKCGLSESLATPADAEAIGGCKERLRDAMPDGRCYSPTVDQKTLTAHFDITTARRNAPSFDKCCRAIESLLLAAGAGSL